MFDSLPKQATDALDWGWSDFQPYFQNLLDRDLDADHLDAWMRDWGDLSNFVDEVYSRLSVAVTVDTTDTVAETRYMSFIQNVYPEVNKVENELNIKLINSDLTIKGMEVPMRRIRAGVEIFREANLPLQVQAHELTNEYDKISGAQTVMWEGEEKTIAGLATVFQSKDRDLREKAFNLIRERRLQDREALNKLWVELFELRAQMAKNADFDNYRDYVWKAYGRFDYSVADVERFHDSIEKVVVPAAERIYARRQQRLGLENLREWDLQVDTLGDEPLKPYETDTEFRNTTAQIFNALDPELGRYLQTMIDENLLDLDNRKGKAPGGYCTVFAQAQRPFIFMNAVGIHDDVQTMLHEAGHAFHAFESFALPYPQMQMIQTPMEFAEVGSMAMELLAAPHLAESAGGFYTEAEALRARIEHLEGVVLFWPYMSVVDSFQQWAYTHPDEATNPANCDAKWTELWHRFMRGVDYSGFEEWVATGWHRKLHIFNYPFYYIEYGLAQLGAVQVWGNSLKNQPEALKAYRHSLALGATETLPNLFAAAGAKFATDVETLGSAVTLVEETLVALEEQLEKLS